MSGLSGRPDSLDALALRVERLSPSHRDPERFFEERSEIAEALRRAAAAQPGSPLASAGEAPRPPRGSLPRRGHTGALLARSG